MAILAFCLLSVDIVFDQTLDDNYAAHSRGEKVHLCGLAIQRLYFVLSGALPTLTC